MHKLIWISGAALALSLAAYAQKPAAPTPGTPPGGSIPTNPTPNNPSNSRLPTQPLPQDQTNFPGVQRPIFLSGKVMLDDGTPPSEPISIQRVCNGVPHTEAYTDSKGRFGFEPGRQMGLLPDASEASYDGGAGMRSPQRQLGGFGTGSQTSVNSDALMMGCELRASLPGFRSDVVNLSAHKYMDNPDIGTIILHRMGNVQGLTISATTAMAPKDARKAFDKGFNATKKQKWDEAQKEMEKAVEVYPKYAAAWFELGLIQQQQGNLDAARKSYAQALAADSKYVKPYEQMALLAAREGKWQDVKDDTDRLLSLNPIDFPQAWFYNAFANYQLRNMDAAEKSAREAIKADSEHRIPKINQLLAAVLAQKRDYAGAAQNLKEYLRLAPTGPDAEMVKKQLAQIEQESQAKSAPAPANPHQEP